MTQPEAPPPQGSSLSTRDRLKVVGLSLGFLIVLGVLTYYVIVLAVPTTVDVYETIGKGFRQGRSRSFLTALVAPVLGILIVLLIAAGIIEFSIGLVHGLLGRRSSVTEGILRGMSHEEFRKQREQMLK